MPLSIYTPSHRSDFLPEVYKSLCAQSDPEWEWDILYNGVARAIGFEDARVHEHRASAKTPPFVGALKKEVCEVARGDLLLELDHDDLLVPDAVASAKEALRDSDFVFSNALHCDANFRCPQRYGENWGWRYRSGSYYDWTLDEPITFEASPASVSRIWFAPNHFRAFRRSLYDKVGGYRSDMRVLDDLDLMCRMYCESDFTHVDKGLYVYRIHGENSWLKHNKEIQNNVYSVYDRYIEKMALAWAKRRGLRTLDLGAAIAPMPGYERVDRVDADIQCDLEERWPIFDSSVGVVRAYDVFEHLYDPLHTMRELYRVLAPGGYAFIQVPSTDGRGAFQDPTHRSFWNQNSFLYYTHSNWARYINTPVRFQAMRLFTTQKDSMEVCWTRAHLVSLKNNFRPPGIIEI